MITIWVHSKYLDEFAKILENVEYYDEIDTIFYTFPKGKEYIQILVSFEEYTHLRDKNKRLEK